jgi:excisionase family DNA binding protein
MDKASAARYLQVSERTIERMVAEGKLVARRVPGKTRPRLEFDRQDLDVARKECEEATREGFVSFRLEAGVHKELSRKANELGLSPGQYARHLVTGSLGQKEDDLRSVLSDFFFLLLVKKLGSSEEEAYEMVKPFA